MVKSKQSSEKGGGLSPLARRYLLFFLLYAELADKGQLKVGNEGA